VGNVVFNLLFIYGFGIKSDGVALGTVLAQYSGFFTGLLLVRKSMKGSLMHWDWPQIPDSAQVKRFLQ
jgi:MATE family multidrug resistance protein